MNGLATPTLPNKRLLPTALSCFWVLSASRVVRFAHFNCTRCAVCGILTRAFVTGLAAAEAQSP